MLAMEGVTKMKGVSSQGCGADGSEVSLQASQKNDGWKFEVFLSFRGADTRNGFTGHLCEALVDNGISTFIDNEALEKGERVEELFSYIERSRMFVPIFSKGYADSKWCLKEITKIVECRRLIVPVFFDVEPSEVQNQSGPFQAAFKRHESSLELNKEEVNRWKDALRHVVEIKGFNLKDANCHEATLKKRILERILNEVKPSRHLDAIEGVNKKMDGEWKYEVCLSFRGVDTRNGFTGHLYEALVEKGISTFIDENGLEKGQRVDELFGYIKRSKIFVPVFSKGYADSKWCLQEITKIVECKRPIIPVFFYVEPSDVQNHSGPIFQAAFEQHERNGELEVSKWKDALRVVGEIRGFNINNANEPEAGLIKQILRRIMNEVNPKHLDVGEYPIGLNYHIHEVVKLLLDAQVQMVGIWGMGGIGKTMLAKAVYNNLQSSFEAFSFLANIREASKQTNGVVTLQQQLLRDAKVAEMKITNKQEGITAIRQQIGNKKVLIVLDDVDHKDQIDALVGDRQGWFSGESRIIVTSRDEDICNAWQSVIYRLPELDPAQSLQLFSLHAFGQSEPKSDWEGELSKKVVSIAGGLPLCLEAFGSHFIDIETSEEGELTLERLKQGQDKEVHERLKVSYDGLDEETKRIFLDMACFLVGSAQEECEETKEKKEYAMLMWECSKLSPYDAIQVLQRKSLISVNDEHGTFGMHVQIRDMGRTIVQQEMPVPSRFWENNKTLNVLQRNKETKNIEGIIFQHLEQQEMPSLNTMSFRNMEKLRILDTSSVRLEGSYHDLPKSLKLLRWWQCPLKSLAIDFNAVGIVVLDLTESTIQQFLGPSETNLWPFGYFLWPFHYFLGLFGYFQPQQVNYSGKFSQLKVLILKDCKNLKDTPDFRLIPNATKLIFEGCTNLGQVHESIGYLQSLVCLNLRDCRSLKKIPDSICRLSSLETLDIYNCERISTLPEMLGDLRSLKKLILDGLIKLKALPESVTCLDNLSLLSVSGCCSLQELPERIGRLKSLRGSD